MRPATPTAARLTNDLSLAKASAGAPLAGLWGGWGALIDDRAVLVASGRDLDIPEPASTSKPAAEKAA